MLVDILGYICSAIVVSTYLLLAGGKITPYHFHWVNFLTAFFIGASAIQHGAYPPLTITASFGAIGLYGVLKELFRPIRIGTPYTVSDRP